MFILSYFKLERNRKTIDLVSMQTNFPSLICAFFIIPWYTNR